MTITTEQLEVNKKLARDYIDQVFNQHNPSKAADFVTGGMGGRRHRDHHGPARRLQPAVGRLTS